MTRIYTAMLLLGILLNGCVAHHPKTAPSTQPSIATTQPGYWIDQPATSRIEADNFAALWDACEQTAKQFGFRLDRKDYRAGVLTTEPLVSKQFFEVWRSDVATGDDLAKSSLATYRRTLRFEIEKNDHGYVAMPCVLIERYASTERLITASVYLRNAFRSGTNTRSIGSVEADRGIYLPRKYWYSTGRDTSLEKNLATEVEKRLRPS